MTIVHAGPERALRSLRADWNRERWEQLPDDGNRYEVIDGVLYMTTAPSAFHQWIVRQIVRALFVQIDDQGVGVTLWAPIGVFMPGCDPVQPDILVVQTARLGIIRDRRIYGVPDLIVEVVSPSNAEQDMDIKRRAYARAAVPEYWIVRPVERDVMVCSNPDPVAELFKNVETIPPSGTLTSPTLPIQAIITDFFANAPDATL
ncbi:MAG: Uma2 family endonuclease [Roseiflexus sp.]|nr:Uma2 family endonuclease [Roseiflexus sp.]